MSCGCPDFLAASRGESLLMFIRLRSPSCCRQQLKQSALPRSAAQCAGVLPSSVTKQQESKGKDGDSAWFNIIFCLLLSLAKLKLSFNLEPFLTSKRDWSLVNISKLDWGHLFIINCLLTQKKKKSQKPYCLEHWHQLPFPAANGEHWLLHTVQPADRILILFLSDAWNFIEINW